MFTSFHIFYLLSFLIFCFTFSVYCLFYLLTSSGGDVASRGQGLRADWCRDPVRLSPVGTH
jgi:hypothetical protein